ncbi:MAG TPA: ComEC/Rec2 family competence protein [Planctomycetota bacterium]|nr:ComEC/Rec2 family competence protein [Planctomycetota bacterium]
MLHARPLVSLAAGFVAGIVLAFQPQAWIPLAILGALAAVSIIRWRHPARAAPAPAAAAWRRPALLFVLGLGLGAVRQRIADASDPVRPHSEPLEGRIQGPPRIYRSLADPRGDIEEDGSFVLDGVQVRFFRQHLSLIGGERVRVFGKIAPPKPATNPGQFDYAEYLRRQGIDAVCTLQKLEVLEGPPPPFRIRAWFRSLFDRSMRPEVGAFMAGITMGGREPIPEDLRTNLQQSGTAHLIAISGQNLVIVMLSLYAILTLAGLRGRLLTVSLIVLLGLYTLLTGLEISVVRSYAMLSAFFGADLAWRRRDSLSALAVSALLICGVDPGQIRDVGFQLSFVAVLGLAFIAPVFHSFSGSGNAAWNWLRMGMGVSLAAWLATAPIVLTDFNLLTPGIVLSNLILVPLMSIEFIIGVAHLAFAPLGLSVVTGTLAELLFDLIRITSTFVTSIPLSYAYAPAAPAGLIAVYYLALAAWTGWCRLRPNRRWRPVAVVFVVALLGLTGILRHRRLTEPFLAVLDVGRGSCAYLEWSDGRNLMVDCGSLNSHDPGATIAAPYLWQRGITRLDTLVLTHPDADHVNGADSLIRRMQVRQLIVTHAFDGRRWPSGVDVVVMERTKDPVRLGDLEFLGPPVWEKFGREVPPNETSIVLRAANVLFPGDIEERGVEELMTLPEIRAKWLLLPHHGKYFRQHREFVRRVAPEVILVSAPEGYFSPKVLEALPLPPRVTGREGAIEIPLK